MRVKVLKRFVDKYTKDLHEVGTELEISKKRYEEINSASFNVLVEEVEAMPDFNSMTKKELVEYAKEKGMELEAKMTKAEMIKELM